MRTARASTNVILPALLLFALGCGDGGGTAPPTAGSVEVAATTAGIGHDPDGYEAVVGTEAQRIGNSGRARFEGVPAGDIAVELRDIAANCFVEGENPTSVRVPADAEADVLFRVSCLGGSIRLTLQVAGPDPDIDGIEVVLGGSRTATLLPDSTIVFDNLSPGEYQLQLLDLAGNCTLASGETNRRIPLEGGTAQDIGIDLSCVALSSLPTAILWNSNRSGNLDLWRLRSSGGEPERLTTDAGPDLYPEASPDGGRIVFASSRGAPSDIYVMDADGGRLRNVTSRPGENDTEPTWSPDGQWIAFTRRENAQLDIYVMRADGSALRNVTGTSTNEREAHWSPGGARLVYLADPEGAGSADIFVINLDGTGRTRLTETEAAEGRPRWSPDGSMILFHGDATGDEEVYVMAADGSGVRNLTQHAASDTYGDWSPDGSSIVLTSDRDGTSQLYTMELDGSGLIVRATGGTLNGLASWGRVPSR